MKNLKLADLFYISGGSKNFILTSQFSTDASPEVMQSFYNTHQDSFENLTPDQLVKLFYVEAKKNNTGSSFSLRTILESGIDIKYA
jgi:hypothetical protein